MSDFQNTIDLLGDEIVAETILGRSIRKYEDDSIENIGDGAFYGCSALGSVNLPSVKSIGASAFNRCAFSDVVFPSATSVGSSAFYSCGSLISAELKLVKKISGTMFSNCYALETFDIPFAEEVGGNAFYACRKLKNVNLMFATSIGNTAFGGCSGLESINIQSATSIGTRVFDDCTALARVTLPANPPTLSNVNAFIDLPKTCVFSIPTGSLTAYQNATNWSSLIASGYQFVEEDR